MLLALGTRLGPYEIQSAIGAGGMGEVYRARDTRLGRDVAVKVLPSSLAADPDRLRRFEHEARAVAALDHPNILIVHDVGSHDGLPYMVTELLEGESLRQVLAGGPLPTRKAIDYAVQVARGLSAAHQKGIVHRDLKPENLFVTRAGLIKILDFGLAKSRPVAAEVEASIDAATRPQTTGLGIAIGTAPYMSPEQVRGFALDERTDIFSFGAVLYEMLSGRRAFGGPTSADTVSAILKEDPPPLAGLREAVSPMLEHIVERCLEKRPDDRFSSAHDLGLALSALSSGTVDRASASGASNDGRAVAATEAARFVSPVARLSARFGARRRRWGLAELAVVAVLAILAVAYPVVVHERRVAWVHNEALPALEVLADRVQFLEEGRESWDAFLLAGKVEQVAPHDPVVERLAPRFTRNITIVSDPPGAEVRAWYYDEPDAAPVVVGKTPLVNIRYPRGFTRLRILLAGRPTIDDVICNTALMGNTFTYRLHAVGELPSGMAWVPGGTSEIYLPGLDSLKAEPVASFLMDRHEVTNREFKQFVDAGGYANPTFWREPFIDRGRELPGNEALARFVDRTGRPGPATWEVGTFPEGGGELPVGGVSWYEAAAYARWAGKSLPTVFHWNRVALTPGSARIAPLANLGRKGPVPVGTTKSENRFGVADLAGNVREWVLNSSGRDGGRYVLGGGWNDPDYAFADAYAQPPFDRSATNGFRCIRYVEKDGNLAELQRALERPTRDFRAEKPVSDAVFEQYLRQFRYDRTPLNAVIEQEKKIPSGTRQKVTFDAAYGSERMTAYLFLPPMGSPPYQVVIVFPGSGAIGAGSSDAVELGRVDFVLKSGRAVMYPIYKGTFERTGTLRSDSPQQTVAYEEFVIMWEKDLARSIDYLETRRDIDTKRIAYYGLSWGAALGAILPAVETRIRANVLYVAGLDFDRALPEVDAINYVGRVKQPTLILNGELDFFFPVETSQRPLFDLLGTPAGDKKRLVYPGGHSVPRTEQIRESLQWFDRYLGPVASTPGR